MLNDDATIGGFMRKPAFELGLPHIYSGKVRDIYDAGDGQLLMVMSDRISAFDVVMDEMIVDKGRVLTAFSSFWFQALDDVVDNHLISTDPEVIAAIDPSPELAGRAMLTRRADMLPIECVVRGYLAGSAWKEYRESATVHGMPMGSGLTEACQLDQPIFTPATKAEDGLHDENISIAQAAELVGAPLVERLAAISLELYERAAARAAQRGVILADTKFEFGHIDGTLVVADEMLTPDSSRFWPADDWQPGKTPPSFDKQPLRDYLDGLDWAKTPPPPVLPDHVVQATTDRYRESYERITGLSFDAWPGSSQ